MMTDNYSRFLDNLTKTRAEKKKEEYLKKLKEKKAEKKKNRKKGQGVNTNEKENGKHVDSLLDDIDGEEITPNNQKEDIQKLLQEENIEIEYIDDMPNKSENFKNVFEYFVIPKKEKKDHNESEDEDDQYNEAEGAMNYEGNDISTAHHPNGAPKMSKKKRKLMTRMKVSELKQMTDHPEVVEAWDVTAQDPILLVRLKSMKNTVQVPKHWSQKRKFLQNKRGVLKQPFKLPDFIEATGISKIRDNTGGNDKKSLKQKMRERMQPKLGKMDIDYQVLHDAFFRYQTKPLLTIQGDVFYENKEHESKMKLYKPGRISEKLRVALGIPENSPPPWLINMQRYGPPPSYHNLKIPGVNAPICDPTAEITPNLWTPPVKEDKPVLVYDFSSNKNPEQSHWGDLRELEEDEMSEDLNEDVSVSDEGLDIRNISENVFSGMDIDLENETKPGLIPIASEINMANAVPNPNANIISAKIQPDDKNFYTILEQKTNTIGQKDIYGSVHAYVIPGLDNKENASGKVEDKKEEEEKKETQTKTEAPAKKKANKTINYKF